MDEPSPAPIIASIHGYLRTAAIQAAIRLDLFTRIAEGAVGVAALAEASGADPRSLRALCDFLAMDGHLARDGAAYRLTPASALFLDRRSRAYLGSVEQFLASPANIAQALADPLALVAKGAARPVGNTAPDNPVWVTYARAMLPLSAPVARLAAIALAGMAPDAGRILDVAAGSGIFGIELLSALPAARAVALDWAPVLEVARENARQRHVADRLEFLAGSAFDTPFGSGFDVAMLANFIHHFDMPTNVTLMQRARAALAPAGRLAIVEFVRPEDAIPPEPIATFALLMRATTPAGDAYSLPEIESMARAAGFARTSAVPLGHTEQTLIVAL